MGLTLATPRPEAQRGGSVMLRLADAGRAQAVLAGLRTGGLHADARGAVLRLSPGNMTTEGGTTAMIAALEDLAR
jgi:kynureninase